MSLEFDFSFEQRTLAESVGKLLLSFPPVNAHPPHAYAPGDVTGRLALLGLFGEGAEGSPLGCADMVAVALEAGRTVVAAPVAEALAVAVAFSGANAELAAALAAGKIVAVASSGVLVEAGGRLSGELVVPHAGAAEFVVAPIGRQGVRAWTLIEASAAETAPAETMDITAAVARITVHSANEVAELAPGAVAMDDALRLAVLAEIVGAADAALTRTVGYVTERKQFGKPIGSNQAVKHIAADCAVAVETMKAAVEYAGWALDAAREDGAMADEARLALLSAASFVGEHGRKVAERCVQMHGGIAFTWDYGLHVPYRRIVFRTATLAGTRAAREALASHLLD